MVLCARKDKPTKAPHTPSALCPMRLQEDPDHRAPRTPSLQAPQARACHSQRPDGRKAFPDQALLRGPSRLPPGTQLPEALRPQRGKS